jgi:hypothetical protein
MNASAIRRVGALARWIILSLCANGDPRARAGLESAYRRLQDYDTRLSDETLGRCFLENVPWHRETVRGTWGSGS